MRYEEFNKFHQQRMAKINSRRKPFELPENFQLKSFEEIVDSSLGCNRCFTLFDIQSGKMVKWRFVREVFGYSDEEFTMDAINNFKSLKLVHKDDIDHKLRYDGIIYNMIASGKSINIRKDSYSLSLRMIHKNGDIIPIRRSSFIFDASGPIPLTQVDMWEITNRYKPNHVFPDLMIYNQDLKNQITEEFYRANLQELKLNFSTSALYIMHFKTKGQSNKTIADELHMKEQSVANCHSRNFEQLRHRFSREVAEISKINFTQKKNHLKKEAVDNLNVFRAICKQFGLYPVPESIYKTCLK
jgi:hypothetical protein